MFPTVSKGWRAARFKLNKKITAMGTILFLCLFSFACMKSEPSDPASGSTTPVSTSKSSSTASVPDPLKIGELTGGVASITADQADIKQGFENWWVNDEGLNLSNLTIGDLSIFSDTQDEEEQYFLVCAASYTESGVSNSRVTGIVLELEEGELMLSAYAGTKHTCTGNPCSVCKLTSYPEGTGCSRSRNDGSTEPGHCDHTVEWTQGTSDPEPLAVSILNALD